MSKRDLKKYLTGLDKPQLEEQLLALYDKFGDVKTYYDFVFRPNEDKLLAEAKAKISNEYFPVKRKRPKLRRSVAQQYIKHFLTLGVDAIALADLMVFTIEVAQKYTAKREMRYDSFYRSIFKSYEQAVNHVIAHGLASDFKSRLRAIALESGRQNWENRFDFEHRFEVLETDRS